jgi:hypothetical protein
MVLLVGWWIDFIEVLALLGFGEIIVTLGFHF